MKLAVVTSGFPRQSETFVLNELLELEQQGVPLHVFSLRKPDDGVFHAAVERLLAPVTYVPESPLAAPRAFVRAHRDAFGADPSRYAGALAAAMRGARRGTAKQFLRAGYIAPLLRRFDIGHVHAHFASTAGAVALHLHRLTGVSYSLTAHAKDIYRHDVDRRKLAAKLDAARFAVTVSDYNARYLSRIAPSSRIVRIYNGLDLERFAPNGRVTTAPPLVLAVGRLVEKKGFDVLVHAFALLRDRGVAARCKIVGKGEREGDLRALIAKLELGEEVELVGPRTNEQLLELYGAASVVVVPSVVGADGNREGLPVVLTEAMALGIPVVATDVTGIPELVHVGRTGLLAPQGDARALADRLRQALEVPVRAAALASAGRERIVEAFNLHTNVAQLRTLFEEALGR